MKKFIDSEIWSDPWFSELKPADKLFWIYLFTNCDKSGLWKANYRKAEFELGVNLNIEKIKETFNGRLLFFDDKVVICKYVKYQYPKILKLPDSPLHYAVLELIKSNSLLLNPDSLLIDYGYTTDRGQEGKGREGNVLSVNPLSVNNKAVPIDSHIIDKPPIGGKSEKIPTWRDSFDIYMAEQRAALEILTKDEKWLSERKKYHPRFHILRSMDKAFQDFWGTESGWIHKKKEKSNKINWKSTYANALTLQCNQVWLTPEDLASQPKKKEWTA